MRIHGCRDRRGSISVLPRETTLPSPPILRCSILLDSNCLCSRSVAVPEYTRHRHLPVTLSDTFSTSVLLQLPLSAAALSPIWSCYKTRGDRFSTLQSLNYRGRSKPTLRSACKSTSNDMDFEVRRLARSQKKRKIPGSRYERWIIVANRDSIFRERPRRKIRYRISLLPGVSNLGADIKVGRDILYEHVGYRPRRRNSIADKAAWTVGHKLEGAFYPRHASTEWRNGGGAKQAKGRERGRRPYLASSLWTRRVI